jgi:C4-dicarboxylate-specific signal transduction histidine kinase
MIANAPMITEAQLTNEIDQLLTAILALQQELATLYRAKREAVRTATAAELDRLNQREGRLVADLQVQLRKRHQILQRVNPMVGPSDTLEKLVQTFAEPQRGRLLARMDEIRKIVEANRRETWVLWIVSKQSLRLFGDLLDLIANGGRKAPVYFAGLGNEMSFGGAILDASA